jgi:hypothetical protein
MSKLVSVSTVTALAIALASCSESTAPSSRTYSVSTTATVPANPTAPILLITNDPQSKVTVTLSVATLQTLAQILGGPAQIKMTDVAPTDYSSLPANEQTSISKFGSRTLTVLVFDVTRTGALASASLASSSEVAFQTGAPTGAFTITECANAPNGPFQFQQIFTSGSAQIVGSGTGASGCISGVAQLILSVTGSVSGVAQQRAGVAIGAGLTAAVVATTNNASASGGNLLP